MKREDTFMAGMPKDEMNLPLIQSEPEKTGRLLVLFNPQQLDKGQEVLSQANIQLASNNDSENGSVNRFYSKLGIAVIKPDNKQLNAIQSANAQFANSEGSPILTMVPEKIVGVDPKVGVQGIETLHTWGLEATNVINSRFSGKGIKVAILDTGFDLNHPDFQGRRIISKSFVDGEVVQDGHGHGTHCTGTACGPKNPQDGRRYGVAYEADIYIGKVLSNSGQGADGSILAGINWAVDQGCHIISMSLGGLVAVDQEYSDIYEQVARLALAKNTLIIAAAGNDSYRDRDIINPVSSPGNCPSILAVGAIDNRDNIARFSNGTKGKYGKVGIAGPGVDVYSSWPMNRRYYTISGTSMATPHVAGIAALYAEATQAKGRDLKELLTKNAKSLKNLSSSDVGSGLIQAP
jgi:subtilisin